MRILTERFSRNLIWLGISIIIFAIILFLSHESLFNFEAPIKSEKYGQFGDAIGGVVGSLWALAGVILFYLAFDKQKESLQEQRNAIALQSEELKLQRKELIETREEFHLTRVSNLLYAQLGRFEKAVESLTVHSSTRTYKGYDAIMFIDKTRYECTTTNDPDIPLEEAESIRKENTIKAIKRLYRSSYDIEKFCEIVFNPVEAFKGVLFNSNLEPSSINELKKLFFENIGFITFNAFEFLIEINENCFEHLGARDYDKMGFELHPFSYVDIFLEPIVLFQKLEISDENFLELKNNWLKSSGRLGM